jgi:hypothetical protein
MLTALRLPYAVPYAAQIASPDLAIAIFEDGLDPVNDPRWAESGADTPEEYAYWVERACGVACVKMCVEALGGPQRPLVDWARAGVARGGYLVVDGENGERIERGWLHQALADLIQSCGFYAQPRPAAPEEIVACLRAGQMVIASACFQLGTDLPITRRGGHLVLILGADLDETGAPVHFYIHNPSGHRAELQTNACIPLERFMQAFTGRVVVAGARA